MSISKNKDKIQSLIDEYHENVEDPSRPHLGCSSLGNSCDRQIWLEFRWAVKKCFPGQMLRLFRRGRNEEKTAISDLRKIGIDLRRGQ
jgi:hypothetical protein